MNRNLKKITKGVKIGLMTSLVTSILGCGFNKHYYLSEVDINTGKEIKKVTVNKSYKDAQYKIGTVYGDFWGFNGINEIRKANTAIKRYVDENNKLPVYQRRLKWPWE